MKQQWSGNVRSVEKYLARIDERMRHPIKKTKLSVCCAKAWKQNTYGTIVKMFQFTFVPNVMPISRESKIGYNSKRGIFMTDQFVDPKDPGNLWHIIIKR